MVEAERRYGLVREAAESEQVDAVIAAGSEYTGFEGAVRYLSGFDIVHRYAHVLLPLDEEPSIVFPAEARFVGEHAQSWIVEQVFADTPGEWLRKRCEERGWRRVGVYGLDYVMNVRDFRALSAGSLELVGFDTAFDAARAIKSEEELDSVRESVRINEAGMWETIGAYEPGRTEAEIMAPASARFVELGCGRHAMNMVLSGTGGIEEILQSIVHRIPAPKGNVEARYNSEDSGVSAEITLPADITGNLLWKHNSLPLHAGYQRLQLP